MENIQINIPKPCRENWQNMTAQQGGRFCENCQKKVIDFSALSDREIVRHFQNQTAPVCGRLSQYQLNRVLLPQPPKPRFGWLAAFLPLSLWGATAAAQSVNAPAFSQIEKPIVKKDIPQKSEKVRKSSTCTVSGIIKNTFDDMPLQRGVVRTKDRKMIILTDDKGFFKIEIPKRKATLQFGAIGYVWQNRTFKHGNHPNIEIVLEQDTLTLLGEVCVVPYRTSRFQRAIHKLKRGF